MNHDVPPHRWSDHPTTVEGRRTEAATSLREAGLEELVERVAQLVRPAALFVASALPDQQIPVGASKVGGWPDLPADVAWPRADVPTFPSWNDFSPSGDTYPIPFLLQINLAYLDGVPLDLDLPPGGILSLFHGADEYETYGDRYEGIIPGWRLLLSPPDAELRRRGPDADVCPYTAQRLRCCPTATLPDLVEHLSIAPEQLSDDASAVLFKLGSDDAHFGGDTNSVRFGGHAIFTGNGEPFRGASKHPRVVGAAHDVTFSASERQLWTHLLSIPSVDYWTEAAGQGVLRQDYGNVSFGGDGVMGMYVRAAGGTVVDASVLDDALTGVIR